MSDPKIPQKLTPVGAAQMLHRRLGYVYLLLREGKLPAQKVDGKWQIEPAAVEQFASERGL